MKEVKPWTDQNGEPLSDCVLKQKSKQWSVDTWEQYLEATNPSHMREDLYSPWGLNRLIEENRGPAFLSAPKKINAATKEKFKLAINALSPKQKFVIEEIFYKNKFDYEVAEILGVSKQAVNQLKNRALDQIKSSAFPEFLDVDSCALVKGLRASGDDKNEEVEI